MEKIDIYFSPAHVIAKIEGEKRLFLAGSVFENTKLIMFGDNARHKNALRNKALSGGITRNISIVTMTTDKVHLFCQK